MRAPESPGPTPVSLSATPLPPNHRRAEAALFGIVVLWGTSFTVVHWALEDAKISPWLILAVRSTLAAALTLVWWPRSLRFAGCAHDWACGAWLGLLIGVGFVTQTIGLETTTPSRSAFITSMTIIFVPILQVTVQRHRPGRGPLLAIPVALAGLCLLTGSHRGTLNAGDVWTLGCALAWSGYIIELQRLSPRADLGRLLLGQFILFGLVCWIVGFAAGEINWSQSDRMWIGLVYLAVACTFIPIAVHNRCQRDTTPTRAALIFVAEPLVATFVSWALTVETLEPSQWLGAALVLLGLIIAELL